MATTTSRPVQITSTLIHDKAEPISGRRRPHLTSDTFVEPPAKGIRNLPSLSSLPGSTKKRKDPLNSVIHNVRSLDGINKPGQSVTYLKAGTATSSNPTLPLHGARAGYGQQFAVASVGNNGMLYLRPIARSQADPQPLYPSTPPRTAEEAEKELQNNQSEESTTLKDHLLNSRTPPHTPHHSGYIPIAPASPPLFKPQPNHRARSHSTLAAKIGRGNKDNTLNHASPPLRPKTAGPDSPAALHVDIPAFDIPPPIFSASSLSNKVGSSSGVHSDIAREEAPAVDPSPLHGTHWLWPFKQTTPSGVKHIGSTTTLSSRLSLEPPPLPSILPPTQGNSSTITTEIFDQLSSATFADDPSVVKYSPDKKEITAGTASKLVAHITSSSFLDYHLLSDFFLTFRGFMTSTDLAQYLLARLRWAIERNDDIGQVVRVRTFVALRHWLLNYFPDDFLPSLHLRELFAMRLNDLADDIKAKATVNQSDLKIINELKKCWRRTCALYWDPITPNYKFDTEKDILPGGLLGTRDDPKAFEEAAHEERLRSARKGKGKHVSRLTQLPPGGVSSQETTKFVRDLVRASKRDSRYAHSVSASFTKHDDHRTNNSINKNAHAKTSSHPDFKSNSENASRPSSPRVPSMPSSPTNKSFKNIFNQSRKLSKDLHKRNVSFSDSLRQETAKQVEAKPSYQYLSFPYPGSLVRGKMAPPTIAKVEIIAPSTPVTQSSLEDVPQRTKSHKTNKLATFGGPGVKKLFGSMRKALTTKHSQTQHSSLHNRQRVPEALTRYVSDSGREMTLTGILSRTGSFTSPSTGLTRIDLLSAGVIDAFHEALREEAALEDQPEHDKHPTLTLNLDRAKSLKHSRMKKHNQTQSVTDTATSIVSVEEVEITPTTPTLHTPPGVNERRSMDVGNRHDSFLDADKIHGRVAIEPWAANGVVTPSPTSGTTSYPRQYSRSLSSQHTPASNRKLFRHGSDGMLSPLSDYNTMSHSTRRSASTSKADWTDDLDVSSPVSYRSQISSGVQTPTDRSPLARPPARMLRRRPGGDLKAATTINELEPDQRNHSIGTIETYQTFSDSSRWPTSSLLINDRHEQTSDVGSNPTLSKGDRSTFGPGPYAEEHVNVHHESLNSTSMPDTFEAGVLRLAELPDDSSDDGGIEVALAKLEGTYKRQSNQRRPSIFSYLSSEGESEKSFDGEQNETNDTDDHEDDNATIGSKRRRRKKQVLDHDQIETPPSLHSTATQQFLRNSAVTSSPTKLIDTDLVVSDGYNANDDRSSSNMHYDILVDRVAKTISGSEDVEHDTTQRDSQGVYNNTRDSISSFSSFHDPLQDLSRSTRISVSSGNPKHLVKQDMDEDTQLPLHPLHNPPTPPHSSTPPLNDGISSFLPGLAGTFPTQPNGHHIEPRQLLQQQQEDHQVTMPQSMPLSDVHLPFILAYDSEMLAKQFTIIEKDALNEIDWKELVELSWKRSVKPIRDWVEFLSTQDSRGLAVIMARFSLVSRWAASEVVMTRSLDERKRCIVKLIHIAAHARRLCNYATMFQITLALISPDIARLKRTWSLVSAEDIEVLKDLESFVLPNNGWRKIRAEMNSMTGETGCIPFIALYLNDLCLNAQKPSLVATTTDHPPLINLSRYRATASIVKHILRLVEAASKYTFRPVDGICERCLWIATLTDEEIQDLSMELEP